MRALLVMQTVVVGQSLVFLRHQTVTGRSDAALPKMHQMSVFYWIQTLWSATTFHLYHLGKWVPKMCQLVNNDSNWGWLCWRIRRQELNEIFILFFRCRDQFVCWILNVEELCGVYFITHCLWLGLRPTTNQLLTSIYSPMAPEFHLMAEITYLSIYIQSCIMGTSAFHASLY